MIKPIIDRLKPEKRQEAMNYAKDYLGVSFNRFIPTEDSATAASLKIDKDQAAALEEMKLTDPDKYKDVVGVLSVPFKSIDVTDPLQLAGSRLQTDFLKRKGAEKVRYELKVAGRDNALKYAASRLQDWKIKYDKATNDQEKMDAVGQIEQWKNRIDSISEDAMRLSVHVFKYRFVVRLLCDGVEIVRMTKRPANDWFESLQNFFGHGMLIND